MHKRKYVTSYMTDGIWYILQSNQISVKRLDGLYETIKPYSIVKRVLQLSNESILERLYRKLTGKVMISLPAPGTRFAVIDKKKFDEYFKPMQRPRDRMR